MIKVTDYIPIVKFLGEALGPSYEVVLHDLRNPENSIVAIINGKISGREIGGPVTDLVLKVLKNGDADNNQFYANYQGKNFNGHVCRSSSFFIHDEKGKTIGVLCINHDITPFMELQKFIDENIVKTKSISEEIEGKDKPSEETGILENFQGSADEVVNQLIDVVLANYKVSPDRFSLKERMEIVGKLNEDGLFLLKGGVTSLAAKLKVSEPTIYRYLTKLKRGGQVSRESVAK
jgi:predicted transcriptional regulator YheO